MTTTMGRKRTKPAGANKPPDPVPQDVKPLDRHRHPRYAFHLEQAILDAMERYCQAQRLVPDKSEVVRVAIREFLEREGFWPPPLPEKEKPPSD